MPTLSSFFASLEEPRKSDMQWMHKLIKEEAPKLKPFILETSTSDVLGYGKFQYETKSGCKGDWSVIGLASRKQYICLYASGMKGEQYLTESYAKKFPKCKCGRSCVQIKKLEDVDEKVLRAFIREAAACDKMLGAC